MTFSVTRSIDPLLWFLHLLLAFSVSTSIWLYNKAPDYPSQQDSTYEYGDLGAIRYGDKCLSTSQQLPWWEVHVVIVEESDNFNGQWESGPAGYWIKLLKGSGTDVDTIAHEVYHMVEHIMETANVEDPHVGAYLQGNWTECVLSIVQRQGQFKFAE